MNALKLFREIHTHPVNIGLHFLTAVLFASSIVLMFYSKHVALLLSILAASCSLIGHLIEATHPAFMQKLFRSKENVDR